MKREFTYVPPIFLSLLFLLSCIEKQDFNQYDELQVRPTVEGSILYVESPESLINLVTGVDIISREFNFDGFSEDYFAERVLSGTITYEVENTTSKQMVLTGELLDEAGNVLDFETFTVPPAPPSFIERREVAYGGATGKSIEIIKNTSAIRISATNLGDNTSVSSLPNPEIIFRSSGKFIIAIR
ncbi:hypothetical protein [Costertonia aggregata]|uniref:Uncharacterized protein n=1 Tax=Costertonia aggregata TaxID=343403 RepID=A0A7H9ARK7_9FLAO|nr:hypothetical protein [Costertonia aggregata]QLG46070.1 hypothetical protein HYG79_12175 [Costertonia aggregata]